MQVLRLTIGIVGAALAFTALAQNKDSALYEAAASGDAARARTLIAGGARVNVKDNTG